MVWQAAEAGGGGGSPGTPEEAAREQMGENSAQLQFNPLGAACGQQTALL